MFNFCRSQFSVCRRKAVRFYLDTLVDCRVKVSPSCRAANSWYLLRWCRRKAVRFDLDTHCGIGKMTHFLFNSDVIEERTDDVKTASQFSPSSGIYPLFIGTNPSAGFVVESVLRCLSGWSSQFTVLRCLSSGWCCAAKLNDKLLLQYLHIVGRSLVLLCVLVCRPNSLRQSRCCGACPLVGRPSFRHVLLFAVFFLVSPRR